MSERLDGFTKAADSGSETPVYFSAGGESLFGVFTRSAEPGAPAAIVLSGGGATAPATNRNRLSVHLCRRLAAEGYHALRFDYHGIGESTGILAGAPKVYEPYLEDVEGATRWVAGQGLEELVLIGACFGGRTALEYAPRLAGLKAVVLVSPPLRDLDLDEEAGTRLADGLGARDSLRRALRVRTVRGLFHPARRRAYMQFVKVKALKLFRRLTGGEGPDDRWVSGRFVEPIRALAKMGVPVLFVYGTEDWHYRDFVRARAGRLGRALREAPLTDVAVLDGPVHGLMRVDVQRRVAELLLDWLRTSVPRNGRLAEATSRDGGSDARA